MNSGSRAGRFGEFRQAGVLGSDWFVGGWWSVLPTRVQHPGGAPQTAAACHVIYIHICKPGAAIRRFRRPRLSSTHLLAGALLDVPQADVFVKPGRVEQRASLVGRHQHHSPAVTLEHLTAPAHPLSVCSLPSATQLRDDP